jgi:small subunit ribosomal protein S6
MAKTGEKYEAVVVFSLKNGEEAIKALVAKFSDLIKEHAELVDVDEWGKRKLAYEIQHQTEGFFYLINFEGDQTTPNGLEAELRILEPVLRYLVVRKAD